MLRRIVYWEFHQLFPSRDSNEGSIVCSQVFHDVAYKAKNREDLLSAIDEFLDQVTVLPPGEWDPAIRIEPPKSVPSQVRVVAFCRHVR